MGDGEQVPLQRDMTGEKKEPKIGEGQKVARRLEEKLLGKNLERHKPESEALEFRRWRRIGSTNFVEGTVQRLLPSGKDDYDYLRKGDLYKKRQEIMETVVDEEMAEAEWGVNEALGKNLELVKEMLRGIREFHRKRLMNLGVKEDTIKVALEHIGKVRSGLEASYGEVRADPLALLIAEVHDIAKYVSVEGKDVTLLAEHETMSAILGGAVIREVLGMEEMKDVLRKELEKGGGDLDLMIDEVGSFVEVVVAAHGKGEFPDEMATKEGVMINPEEGMIRFPDKYGGGVYYRNWRPMEELFIEGVGIEKQNKLWDIHERGRMADMVTGVDPRSFIKYHNESKLGRFYDEDVNSSYDFVKTFAGTFMGYQVKMPRGVGAENIGVFQEARLRGGYLFAALEAIDKGDGELGDFRQVCVKELGEAKADEILNLGRDMRKVYFEGKKNWNEALDMLVGINQHKGKDEGEMKIDEVMGFVNLVGREVALREEEMGMNEWLELINKGREEKKRLKEEDLEKYKRLLGQHRDLKDRVVKAQGAFGFHLVAFKELVDKAYELDIDKLEAKEGREEGNEVGELVDRQLVRLAEEYRAEEGN